jgi:hypothetical protein
MKLLLILFAISTVQLSIPGFEGRIAATMTQGTETKTFLYTAGTNCVRIERTETNWPHPVNIASIDSGDIALVYPHNRSFVRLKSGAPSTPPLVAPSSTPGQSPVEPHPVGMGFASAPPTVAPGVMANLPHPPGSLPPGVGPQNLRGTVLPPMSAFPLMRVPLMPQSELKATGETTNILGFACARYELTQRGETVEIWATDKLLPFQPWLQSQPRRFGPRLIDEEWAESLKQRKLFPLFASLKFDNGLERFRFEVKSITPEKIRDPDGALFQPPAPYHEVEPAPF